MDLGGAYEICDALAVLSATRNPQELTIWDIATGYIPTYLPNASIPQIEYLKFNGRSCNTTTLLAHIQLPMCCSLTIRINSHQRQPILSSIDTFAQKIKCFSKSHLFNGVDLEYIPGADISLTYHTDYSVDCSLSISIPLGNGSDSFVF